MYDTNSTQETHCTQKKKKTLKKHIKPNFKIQLTQTNFEPQQVIKLDGAMNTYSCKY